MRPEVRNEREREDEVRDDGGREPRAAAFAPAREEKRMERRDVLDQERGRQRGHDRRGPGRAFLRGQERHQQEEDREVVELTVGARNQDGDRVREEEQGGAQPV